MSHVSKPKQDEYFFQYSLETEPEVSYKKVTVEEIVKHGKRWDKFDIQAKAVEIGRVRKVQQRTNLNQGQQTEDIELLQAILADTTGTIHLDIWSRHTDQLNQLCLHLPDCRNDFSIVAFENNSVDGKLSKM